MLKTGDGGETWERQFLSSTDPRSDMVFLDALLGWVVLSQGGLLHTSDGGSTWQRQPGLPGVPVSVSGVFFLDENNGWIAGLRGRGGVEFLSYLTDGMVARTTDGGASWTRRDVRTGRALLDVAFMDDRRGWAVGTVGTILYSDDGGISWERQASGTKETLRSIAFSDDANGWAVGEAGTILKFTPRPS